jgi:hypothetical protein
MVACSTCQKFLMLTFLAAYLELNFDLAVLISVSLFFLILASLLGIQMGME